jgi:hypothetical protein
MTSSVRPSQKKRSASGPTFENGSTTTLAWRAGDGGG